MVYHIASFENWEKALERGYYITEDYKQKGFIYCATLPQIREVAECFFGHFSEILILHIVEKRIKHLVEYRQVEGLSELYPCILGRIPLFAIENVSIVDKNEEGNFDWENWKYY